MRTSNVAAWLAVLSAAAACLSCVRSTTTGRAVGTTHPVGVVADAGGTEIGALRRLYEERSTRQNGLEAMSAAYRALAPAARERACKENLAAFVRARGAGTPGRDGDTAVYASDGFRSTLYVTSLIRSLVEGDQAGAASIVAAFLPDAILSEEPEFFVAARANDSLDPIVLLCSAWRAAEDPIQRQRIAAALRRSLIEEDFVWYPDQELVRAAAEWRGLHRRTRVNRSYSSYRREPIFDRVRKNLLLDEGREAP